LEELSLRERRLYPATILVDLEPGMEAFDNELFGPAASVMRAKDDAHAVELANNSQFGSSIHGYIKREKLALQPAGSSFVNKLVVSDPRLPLAELKIAATEEN
jgi:succinate-semialdehyde dehydrogenase/glutarate-semialdehyde dehydrogenase